MNPFERNYFDHEYHYYKPYEPVYINEEEDH
jgi:hypothetical protein